MTTTRFDNRKSAPRKLRGIHLLVLVSLVFVLFMGSLLTFNSFPFGHGRGAHANDLTKLPGHVPGLIKNSHLLGSTDSKTSITIMVGLSLRNQSDLQTLVNSNAGHRPVLAGDYLTPDQFTARFAPLQSSQDDVIAYMQQAGFRLTKTYNHRLLVGFSGTIGQAEHAFHVQINNYTSAGGRQFFAPTTDPSLPAYLAATVQSIIGLDSVGHLTHTQASAKTQASRVANSPNITCATTGSGHFLPSQIATAYNLTGLYTAGFNGEQQSVAVFELDDYLDADLSAYTSCFGMATTTITRVPVSGGITGGPGGSAGSVESDIELLLSAAPKLAAIKVYETTNTPANQIAQWGQIVNDKIPVVSTSWGQCEQLATQAFAAQENTLFITAAAQHQSIIAASGDSGSNDCSRTPPTTPSVDDPAAQPYVTGVGGTTLTLGSGNAYGSEVVWDTPTNGNATGGGISSFWAMPSWQQGPGVINTTFSSGTPCGATAGNYCREVPDVSLHADPKVGYLLYCSVSTDKARCSSTNPWRSIGGTEEAATMWAAFVALADQKSVHDGNANLGFLNPLLYQIGQSALGTSYTNDFHDITSGNNYTTGDGNNEYPATASYDMTTGWGSYNALPLATDLESVAKTLSLTPTPSPSPSPSPTPTSQNWYFAEGKVGGGFTEWITIENPSSVNDCAVNIQYLLGSGNPVNKGVIVPHASRFTEYVNGDLNTAPSGIQQFVSSIVSVTNPTTCNGIVAERPMYFTSFVGVSSGSDVLGSTHLGTTFYFADVPTGGNYASFITVLNPISNPNPATVTATFVVGGQIVSSQTQTITVAPGQRGTVIPKNNGTLLHAAVTVTSSEPVVAERPTYFSNIAQGNAGTVTGSSSVVGVQALQNEWFFAEGYTGNGFQEYLALANFGTTAVTGNAVLEFSNGHTESVPFTIQPSDQTFIDVNHAIAFSQGTCDTNPCQPTQDVSADITGNGPFIAQREMYFHYTHVANGRNLSSTGGTDVIGQGTNTITNFSFAEGYTNVGYDEWLTLQNPTGSTETITLTVVNEESRSTTQSFQVVAHSRYTIDITALVLHNLILPGDTFQGYEVSMVVQSISGAFVAERPMYWNTGGSGTQGGSDVIGYTGQ